MQIVPTLEKVQEIASARRYRVLPVSCEILSDFTTPIEAMRILKQVSTHCYMLESAASHETWGRYTFLGFDPSLEITCRNGEMRAGCLHFPTADPSAYLRQVLAEHNMLVDLGRNDLGKISRFGAVQVEKFHTIERFSHVMHIGSTVRGKLREDKDALDAIEAVLPAGTLSGAPKLRACQLIAELENNKRGIYGGAIGYIDFTGNMDTCIAIRIAYQKNGRVFVRSGAGIVADSVPEQEFEECMNKARASLRALELAQEAEL